MDEFEVYEGPVEYVDCGCGRGTYNPHVYRSCYQCYLDRCEGMLSCIFCGRWHSEEFDTCFQCRAITNRDEAAQSIRTYIEWRDGYRCRNCGAIGVINIDHIQPCKKGGTAALWNLQVLCQGCNRVKGAAWYPGGQWSQVRRGLYAYYATAGRTWLDNAQRLYAKSDYDARESVVHLEVWDRWLAHDASIVFPDFGIFIDPQIFYCPECGASTNTFYGTGQPICLSCWMAHQPELART